MGAPGAEVELTAQEKIKAATIPAAEPEAANGPGELPSVTERPRFSLSTRMLAITVLTVMVVEVLIYIPSIANFRHNYLLDKLTVAQIIGLLAESTPDMVLPPDLEYGLLDSAGIEAIIVRRPDRSIRLELGEDFDFERIHNLQKATIFSLIGDAFRDMFVDYDRHALIRGHGTLGDIDDVSIVLDLRLLHKEMRDYSRNILFLSFIISVATGALIFLSVRRLFIKPLDRMVSSINAFRAHPMEAPRFLALNGRHDEIGQAERQLGRMQEALSRHIAGQRNLAMLGRGMAKVNHDLRNILATIQMQTERLSSIEDPTVQRLAGRMINAAERAIALCERTMRYARAETPKPDKRPVSLHRTIAETCAAALGLEESDDSQSSRIRFRNQVPADLVIDADSGQLFRIFLNLARNARQALEQHNVEDAEICVCANVEYHVVRIRFEDNGPGIPDHMLDQLFASFAKTTKTNGTGLGLSIVEELVAGHGGDIQVDRKQRQGTAFIITLPLGNGAAAEEPAGAEAAQ